VVVELPCCRSNAVARGCGDFAVSTQGATGGRDGSAGALSYVSQGSQGAHGSETFSNIKKISGSRCPEERKRFHPTIIYTPVLHRNSSRSTYFYKALLPINSSSNTAEQLAPEKRRKIC
jgi:hypothetical protein